MTDFTHRPRGSRIDARPLKQRQSRRKIMHTDEKSLHWAVDKWLAPTPAMPARVVRFCRSEITRARYVCVEALHPGGMLAIIFFRHEDGSWNVFPPQAKRPSMGFARIAA
jgi:hypothetical protein